MEYPVTMDTYLFIDDFSYNIFNGDFYTDLNLIKKLPSYVDTVLHIPNINLRLSIWDILLSRKIQMSQLEIQSPKISLPNSLSNDSDFPNNLLSVFSSIQRETLLSNLLIHNISIYSSDQKIDSLDLKASDFVLGNNNFLVRNFSIHRDSSFVSGNCIINDTILKLNIDTAFIHSGSTLFNFIPVSIATDIAKSTDLNFSGQLSLNMDSVQVKSNLKYGPNQLNCRLLDTDGTLQIFIEPSIISLNYFNTDLLKLRDNKNQKIEIAGNFTMTRDELLDYIGNGELNCDYGILNYSFHIDSQKQDSQFLVQLKDFNVGHFINSNLISYVNGDVKLQTHNQKINTINLDFKSIASQDYIFNNFNFNGVFDTVKNLADFQIYLKDENLDFHANINLKDFVGHQLKNYDFLVTLNGQVNKLDLNNLKFRANKSLNFIKTKFKTNQFIFKDANPNIYLTDFQYSIDNSYHHIDYLNIDFPLINLADNHVQLNLSSSIGTMSTEFLTQNGKVAIFACSANLTSASVFSDIFSNSLKFNKSLNFEIDYKHNVLSHLLINTPSVKFRSIDFLDINCFTTQEKNPTFNVFVDSIQFLENFILDDFDFVVDMKNQNIGNFDLTSTSIGFDNPRSKLSGELIFFNDVVNLNFNNQSFVHFSNQSWTVDSLSSIDLSTQGLQFNKFSVNLGGEALSVRGVLSQKPNLSFAFQDFKISHLNSFVSNPNILLDGFLNGNIRLNKSIFPMFSGDIEVDEFHLNNVTLGSLKLNSFSNQSNDSLYTNGVIYDDLETMTFNSKYPFDGSRKISADISFMNFPAEVLDSFIEPISHLRGDANGNLQLTGIVDDYRIFGATQIDSIDFKIPYLNTRYLNHTDDLTVFFRNDSIIINNYTFYDKKHNTSADFSGKLKHTSLKDMFYNLEFHADSLYTLNTNNDHNEHYYGESFIGGSMFVDGNPEKVILNIDAIAKNGSKLVLPLSKSKEISENQFIQFTKNDEFEQPANKQNRKSKFNMNFNLDINNDSQIQLIFDEEVGDLIKGYGQGNLFLKIPESGNLEVFGDFSIEEGHYLFTLQDVITKSFEIEKGGGIRFNGDPYNALMDLSLLYNVQASLHPLNPEYDRKIKSPVICKMAMLNNLLNPDIQFSIEVPNADQVVEASLETMTNTDQKLLEQFLYLLIANSFLIENDPTIDYLGNTLATTGTELLSSQLSNWLSQTTDAFDLGFKWVPGTGDSLSYQQVELAVSKKFLDDRVIVNGNVGTPPEQSEADIIGDLDIEYHFFKDGRLKLRVFNRAEDYDPLSESLGYEQGFGIFFRKRFDTFKDLFKKNRNMND